MKKYKFYVLVGLAFIFGVTAIFVSYIWYSQRQDRVAMGFAKAFWPYVDYSMAELEKMYPQYANVDVPTTQTPEETHAKFITALKKGDLDEAVKCCFREGDWEKMRAGLEKTKEEGFLDNMITDLNNIKSTFKGDTIATYSFVSKEDGGLFGHTISFAKNNQGVWMITAL